MKIKEKLNKKERSQNFTNNLLRSCKSWNGPFTTVNELDEALENFTVKYSKEGRESDELQDKKQVIKTEIWYRKRTQPRSSGKQGDLYKITIITYQEMLAKCIILTNDSSSKDPQMSVVCDLPSNKDVLDSLSENKTNVEIPDNILKIGSICASVWIIGYTC